ncbi:MAG: sigma-70 family RNA polymerase sigma factor [Spirochaetaceae bacterium]|nr:sigma-70 family RNA polymerase sigma factor [Spirochaetaceae bacterium]
MPEKNRSLEHEIIAKRDSILIKNVLQGDTESFAKLVKFYKHKVHVFGMGFFKNEVDTDDFVQEVFIKVYTKLSTFRGDSLFSTWLMRIAYNTAVNSVNRRKEYASLSDDFELEDTDLTPEQSELRKITMLAVREAITELPERYRICLDMYFFYDMTYNEISETVDLPVNTIKSHIFRAKKILKDKLQETVTE